MTGNSFYKKVICYLAEINKGTQGKLVENGWLCKDEERRIKVILEKLALIEYIEGKTLVTARGLNILLYYKMGKLDDDYNEEILEILLNGK